MSAEYQAILSVIADAGMGWAPPLRAMNSSRRACSACTHFEMRMIKSGKSDSFGHLLPWCNHPKLGDRGAPTQTGASCSEWSAK